MDWKVDCIELLLQRNSTFDIRNLLIINMQNF